MPKPNPLINKWMNGNIYNLIFFDNELEDTPGDGDIESNEETVEGDWVDGVYEE